MDHAGDQQPRGVCHQCIHIPEPAYGYEFYSIEHNHILNSGPQEWEVHNDFLCFGDFGKTMISFTTCSDDQFTCRSGLCVEIGDRKVYITFNAMNLLD